MSDDHRNRSGHEPWARRRDRPTGHDLTCPACGKKAYKTKRLAKKRAAQIYPGVTMRTYPCGDLWHLTSQDAASAEYHRGHR